MNNTDVMNATDALMETLNAQTKKHTAFRTFAELVNQAVNNGYRPTLRSYRRKDNEAVRLLRTGFDAAMVMIGRDTRAWPETGWRAR